MMQPAGCWVGPFARGPWWVNADRPLLRERLTALLWGDRGERQARQSLSHALRSIQSLGAAEDVALLDYDGERVTLRGDSIDVDVLRFRVAGGFFAGPAQ